MPSKKDLARAARSLRRVAEETESLPDDKLADGRLRDRLELAADVLDATADATADATGEPPRPT